MSYLLEGPLPTVEELMAALERNGCPLLGPELSSFAETVQSKMLMTRVLGPNPLRKDPSVSALRDNKR